MWRYARLLPVLWRSEVNDAVVRELALQPGERVIDLGAGAGAATVAAASTGAEVLALDPTPLMRNLLRLRRLAHARRAAITIRDGAAESIPAADRSIDALWSVNTLHHWTDLPAAVVELARVLKPEGRVLLLDEAFDDSSHPAHAELHQGRRKLVFDEVDPQVIARALRDAGFATAEGRLTRLVDRPVKLVRATR